MVTLTPYQRAQAVYQCEPCARPFEEDMEWHLRLGYVITTPTLFMLARRVSSEWDESRLLAPWYVHPNGDALWVWLLAGDMVEALTAVPWPDQIKRIGFERGNAPRWHDRENLVAKLLHQAYFRKCGNLTDLIGNPASSGRMVA